MGHQFKDIRQDERLTSVQDVLERFSDVLGGDLGRDVSIHWRDQKLPIDAKDIRMEIDGFLSDGRSLTVGIVGRVKAGKSSLLNGLIFDGKAVLPQAPTPMTAALTVLGYANAPSAIVHFFSREDLDHIFSGYKAHKQALENKVKELREREQKRIEHLSASGGQEYQIDVKGIEKSASQQLEERPDRAQFEQWELMLKQESDPFTRAQDTETFLSLNNTDELSAQLHTYVGVDGTSTPFTKMVELNLNDEALRDLKIIDTPGINDPVVSREERTKEMLAKCDVAFVVTPAAQFLDKETIMLTDRLSRTSGLRELYVVASQVDMQLSGSKRDHQLSNFEEVYSFLSTELADRSREVFSKLKKDSPMIGNEFDLLINEANSHVLLTSAICDTIARFPDRINGDADLGFYWNSLKKLFPDTFSDNGDIISREGLRLLGGVDRVRSVVDSVRSRKESIVQKRAIDYQDNIEKSITLFGSKAIESIDKYILAIKQTELKTAEEEARKTREGISIVEFAVKETLREIVRQMRGKLINKIKSIADKTVKGAEEKIEKSKTIRHEDQRNAWQKFWKNAEDLKNVPYLLIRPESLNKRALQVADELAISVSEEFDGAFDFFLRNSQSEIMPLLKKANINPERARKTFVALVGPICDIAKKLLEVTLEEIKSDFSSRLPKASGTLKHDVAKDFVEDIQIALDGLRLTLRKKITSVLKEIENLIDGDGIGDNYLRTLIENAENYEQEVRSKRQTILRLTNLRKEIAAM